MNQTPPSFLSRIAIAIGSFFAILGNARLASDITRLRGGEALAADVPPVPPKEVRIEVPVEKIVEVRVEVPVEKIVEKVVEKRSDTSALQLLGLLQREARFVDFVQEDVVGYTDAEVGAAARVVHEGCRKVLGAHFSIRGTEGIQDVGGGWRPRPCHPLAHQRSYRQKLINTHQAVQQTPGLVIHALAHQLGTPLRLHPTLR